MARVNKTHTNHQVWDTSALTKAWLIFLGSTMGALEPEQCGQIRGDRGRALPRGLCSQLCNGSEATMEIKTARMAGGKVCGSV